MNLNPFTIPFCVDPRGSTFIYNVERENLAALPKYTLEYSYIVYHIILP